MVLVKYKFVNDEKHYSCYMNYEQYKNFQELTVIQECKIYRKNHKNINDNEYEMQKALDFALKNDTSHIKKLSKIIL